MMAELGKDIDGREREGLLGRALCNGCIGLDPQSETSHSLSVHHSLAALASGRSLLEMLLSQDWLLKVLSLQSTHQYLGSVAC